MIKTNLNFKLGTGDTDEMCYESVNEKDGSTLNRYGALRLLSIIHKTCSCLANKERSEASNHDIMIQVNFPGLYNDNIHRRNTANRQSIGQPLRRRNIRQNEYSRRPEYSTQRQQPVSYHYGRTQNYSNGRSDDWRQNGCFNCGEYNHRQMNCRYDHRIRCNYCYKFGHKSRMCTLQNN